jgi:uncharacterized protein (TIGR02147 family)
MVAMRENTVERPAPESFDDYRAYLRAMINFLKATRPQFSYRYFSRMAGFSSPNFLKLVAEGKRNMSTRSITKFSRGLGLDPQEAEAFETLVLLSQAQTDEERNRHYQRLRRHARRHTTAARLEEAQYRVYSLWYILPIRELLLHPDFREDPTWIGRRLNPEVKAPEVRQALSLLEEVGLAVRDEQGRLRPSTTRISTGPRVRSLAVRNFHRSMLELASNALEAAPQDQRDVTALTLTLSRRQFELVRGRIAQFRRELLDLVEEEQRGEGPDVEPREVYQVGFQLFPLTAPPVEPAAPGAGLVSLAPPASVDN